ncbi:MAG: DUF1905 domain-containing protein [Bacteroidetes bacterium]|nr:DUF1905 domain-containing protein [Bacteroidota bacterium]
MEKKIFEAELKSNPKYPNAAYIEIPFDVEEVYGKKNQVKVLAHFDGISYRGSLVKMGMPCHVLPVLKEIREKLGKTHGNFVTVELERDTKPRVAEVPLDLKELLKQNPEAKAYFEKLSYTHQKEYVNWINSAKKEATRERRLNKTIEMLHQSIKNP